MARGHTLERVGDEIARAPLGLGARFLLELADTACELMPDEVLRALEQRHLRLVHGHARDPLARGQLLLLGVLLLLFHLLAARLPVAAALPAALHLRQLLVD